MNLGRPGLSTGTCAAAAAKAAACVLCGQAAPAEVDVELPEGGRVRLPVFYARVSNTGPGAEGAVRKDAGDDPDVTHGALVVSTVEWTGQDDVTFAAGDGVGVVTRPGLALPVGEPAINPVPRNMIRQAVREVTPRGVRVTVSIPGGRELAGKTYNPRLGIVGGLSVLGTTGRVRPFSHAALRTALKCGLDVAVASGIRAPVFVPGHLGARAAKRHFPALRPEQIIEVSNEWGFMLEQLRAVLWPGCARGAGQGPSLLALGHPGKLAKLAAGAWDTHSARSGSAVGWIAETARRVAPDHLPGASPLLFPSPSMGEGRVGVWIFDSGSSIAG